MFRTVTGFATPRYPLSSNDTAHATNSWQNSAAAQSRDPPASQCAAQLYTATCLPYPGYCSGIVGLQLLFRSSNSYLLVRASEPSLPRAPVVPSAI